MRDGRRQSGEAPPLRRLYEWVQVLACAVLAVVLVFTFGVRLVTVSGPSMRETLQDGDCLLVVNAPLCGDFAAGDIVILRRESFRDGEPIVKRIIATEGQAVFLLYPGMTAGRWERDFSRIGPLARQDRGARRGSINRADGARGGF